jgi:hypothetical protein
MDAITAPQSVRPEDRFRIAVRIPAPGAFTNLAGLKSRIARRVLAIAANPSDSRFVETI